MKYLQLIMLGAFLFNSVKIGYCHCDVVRLAAAVHETLSPFMSEMRENLAAVKNDIRVGMTAIEQKMKEEFKEISDFQMAHHGYKCGGTEGWRRVVYLDMTDPNTNCPSGWNLTTYSKRTCGRANNSELSCDSVVFPVSGDYTSVCGSIRAYQYGPVDGFEAYHDRYVATIDEAYVAGVSLTHGSPRQHIWTFAAGYSESSRRWSDACPCDAIINITIPPFVGKDYFCESGVNFGLPSLVFYPEDPLWDGEGCNSSSSCCSFNNPPYFTKQLPSPTSDLIEARICMMVEDEDSAVELIELYVK